jgi:hypothetical protein
MEEVAGMSDVISENLAINLAMWCRLERAALLSQLDGLSKGTEVTMSLHNGKMVDTSAQTAISVKQKLADLKSLLPPDATP